MIEINDATPNAVREAFVYSFGWFCNMSIKKNLSDSIMLDVWNDKKLYVFEFELHRIGFSEVEENVGFDNIPDKILLNSDMLRLVLMSIV